MYLCVYCGDIATTRDHVPPRCIAPFNTVTYPACVDCNMSILKDRVPYATVDERRAYVVGKLRARLAKMPVAGWTEEELAELGPGLARQVRCKTAARTHLIERLSFSEGVVTSQEATGTDENDNTTAEAVRLFQAV